MNAADRTPGDPTSRDELSTFDKFEWNLLGDLAFEDTYALWEIASNADLAFENLPLPARRVLAAQAVSDLLVREWAFLFRLGGLDPNAASERLNMRLDRQEAEECISRLRESGTTAISGDVWIAASEKGTSVAYDPPPPMKSLWGWAD